MNFWIIFLCLVIGAVVGFEFGKYMVSKRVHDMLDKLGKELQKTADELKKKKELAETIKQERTNNLAKLMTEILPKMDPEDFRRKMGTPSEEELPNKQGANENGQGN